MGGGSGPEMNYATTNDARGLKSMSMVSKSVLRDMYTNKNRDFEISNGLCICVARYCRLTAHKRVDK